MALSYVNDQFRGASFDAFLAKDGVKVQAPAPILRVIPLEEVAATDWYADMADLAVIFQHEIVEVSGGPASNNIWRWKPNSLMRWISDYTPVYTPAGPVNEAAGRHSYGNHCKSIRASLSLNDMVVDLHRGAFSMEEWMKFYMQIGYSLSGYAEVFGQREAVEYGLPGALVPAEDADGNRIEQDHYTETVIEYMRRNHTGEILSL